MFNLVGIIIVVFAVSVPFLTIWSLNTLFPVLAIPFTVQTWLAVLWLIIWTGAFLHVSTSKRT